MIMEKKSYELKILLPDHQSLDPPSGKQLGDTAYLHSLSLNSESESQGLPCPGFVHMQVKPLFHY
jgi:hypothetical protein